MRILSGVQPSGKLHLGNYFGAIRQFVELQHEGEALYFIANLHSLTTVSDPDKLREFTLDTALTYLSFGVDPERAILFRQSDVPEHSELFWILGSLVPLSHLERAHSYKEKTAKGLRADFGLFAYPILMAADILLYGTDLVPVGKDQKQHVEFARDWAIKFNQTYVRGYDPADPNGEKGVAGVLRVPDARIQAETATILGVDGQKMSKSYDNTIELFAPDNVLKKCIMGIKTDSSGVDDPKPVEGSALHSLLSVLVPAAEFAEVDRSWRAGGSGYGVYKQRLLEAFHATFDPVRARRAELEKDLGAVEAILARGAERARNIASEQLDRVKRATGLR
jgi:tryptophanyl-tRNA synthetase